MSLASEFMDFLKEFKVIGLAVAITIGLAATQFVKALVDYIIMPIITPFIPGGAWQQATFTFWKITLSWGAFLGALINFVVIALAVFLIVKKLIERKPKKK